MYEIYRKHTCGMYMINDICMQMCIYLYICCFSLLWGWELRGMGGKQTMAKQSGCVFLHTKSYLINYK